MVFTDSYISIEFPWESLLEIEQQDARGKVNIGFVHSFNKGAPVPGSVLEAHSHPREQEQGVSGAALYPNT